MRLLISFIGLFLATISGQACQNDWHWNWKAHEVSDRVLQDTVGLFVTDPYSLSSAEKEYNDPTIGQLYGENGSPFGWDGCIGGTRQNLEYFVTRIDESKIEVVLDPSKNKRIIVDRTVADNAGSIVILRDFGKNGSFLPYFFGNETKKLYASPNRKSAIARLDKALYFEVVAIKGDWIKLEAYIPKGKGADEYDRKSFDMRLGWVPLHDLKGRLLAWQLYSEQSSTRVPWKKH